MIKNNRKDFEYFKNRCKYYIQMLGLGSWAIYYSFEKMNDNYAVCRWNYRGRVATLVLSKVFDIGVEEINKKKQIDVCALHECLELLMSPIKDLAEDRTWCDAEYEKEKHCIIRTIENIFIGKQL